MAGTNILVRQKDLIAGAGISITPDTTSGNVTIAATNTAIDEARLLPANPSDYDLAIYRVFPEEAAPQNLTSATSDPNWEVTWSGAYSGRVGWWAFDSDQGTMWCTYSAAVGDWLCWEYKGTEGSVLLRRYSIAKGSGNGDCPTGWKIQGSNDGSIWVDLDEQTGQSFPDNNAKEYTIPNNSTPYKFHRFYLLSWNTSNMIGTFKAWSWINSTEERKVWIPINKSEFVVNEARLLKVPTSADEGKLPVIRADKIPAVYHDTTLAAIVIEGDKVIDKISGKELTKVGSPQIIDGGIHSPTNSDYYMLELEGVEGLPVAVSFDYQGDESPDSSNIVTINGNRAYYSMNGVSFCRSQGSGNNVKIDNQPISVSEAYRNYVMQVSSDNYESKTPPVAFIAGESKSPTYEGSFPSMSPLSSVKVCGRFGKIKNILISSAFPYTGNFTPRGDGVEGFGVPEKREPGWNYETLDEAANGRLLPANPVNGDIPCFDATATVGEWGKLNKSELVQSVNGQLPDESGNVTIETNAFGEWINFEPSGQVMLTHNFNDRFAVGILQLLDADGRIYSLNDRVTYNTNYINIDYTGLLLTGTHKARFFNSSASMGGLQPPAGALALYENYSGGNWADSSGNGYDLTASGSITAQNGEAFFPDATGKLLAATNWPLGNNVTFSVVVSAQDRVCWFGCSKGILGIFDNGFTFGKTYTRHGHSARIPTAVLSGKFHLLMTLNGTSVQYYLNGEQMELSGTDDWTTATVDGLGNVYTNYPFTSHTIAHCAIYNSILTAEDISKCWNYVKAKYNL